MLEQERAFFVSHQQELVKKFAGKALLIHGDSIDSVHDTPLRAYLDAQQKFAPGTFMIQICAPGPDAYTARISSVELVVVT